MNNKAPRKGKGIQSRLIRVFATQAALVSLAAALGVFAAYKIAENVLVKEALKSEADHYFELVDANGDYPLPNTKNLIGYRAKLDGLDSLPAQIRELQPGYGRQTIEGKSPLVLVTQRDDERLYLLFKEEQVSNLAIYFGVAPLTVVLILIYSASWFTFRQSQRVISPVVQLAKVVKETSVADSQYLADALKPFHKIDEDVDTLAIAIEDFNDRLQSFVERERTFTRDASHELRTPLAVLNGSIDVLQQMEKFSEKGDSVVLRMRQTIADMASLLETLLMLVREDDGQLEVVSIDINELLQKVSDDTKSALEVSAAQVEIINHARIEVTAPNKVLNILFTNLLKNALHHGKGASVTVDVNRSSVTISDRGPGMSEDMIAKAFQPFYRGVSDDKGHGLGLSIVKRLCERFAWQLVMQSEPGQGTSVTVSFPNSREV
jgi:signal transduction histidine kinase